MCVCVCVCVRKEGQESREWGKEKKRQKQRVEGRETGRCLVVDWTRHAHQKLSMNTCKYDGCVWV